MMYRCHTSDSAYIVEVLARGVAEELAELSELVPGFPQALDPSGSPWLCTAIVSGAIGTLQWMVQHGAALDFRDPEGRSAVHCALERSDHGRHAVLAFLLAQGAPHDLHGSNDWTPAHMAAVYEDLPSLELLIRHGADLTRRTRIDGCLTPLEQARALGKQRAVDFLEGLARRFEPASMPRRRRPLRSRR